MSSDHSFLSAVNTFIKENVTNAVAARGRAYNSSRILGWHDVTPNEVLYEIQGTQRYSLTISFNDTLDELDAHCTCPYGRQRAGRRRHNL